MGGFPLVGRLPRSGTLPLVPYEVNLSEAELDPMATRHAAMVHRVVVSSSPGHELQVAFDAKAEDDGSHT